MKLVSDTARPPARTGARGPYANGERRRAELVAAATTVFAEKGYRRMSLRQIADELGTSHNILMHHFGSKDALLQAVMVLREERDRPVREQILREKGLLDGLPEIMRRNATMRGIIHLDATLQAEAISSDHPAHDFVCNRDEEFVASLLAELQLEHCRGRLRADLPLPVIARQLAALVEGLQVHWLNNHEVDMAVHIAVYLDQLRSTPTTGDATNR